MCVCCVCVCVFRPVEKALIHLVSEMSLFYHCEIILEYNAIQHRICEMCGFLDSMIILGDFWSTELSACFTKCGILFTVSL